VVAVSFFHKLKYFIPLDHPKTQKKPLEPADELSSCFHVTSLSKRSCKPTTRAILILHLLVAIYFTISLEQFQLGLDTGSNCFIYLSSIDFVVLSFRIVRKFIASQPFG
jgi:hypothetical protein